METTKNGNRVHRERERERKRERKRKREREREKGLMKMMVEGNHRKTERKKESNKIVREREKPYEKYG